MANTITNVLPTLLARGLQAARQNAITTRLINRDLESFAAQKGNVINVPISSAIAARAVTPSITMNSNVDSSPTTVAVTLDQWTESPFQLSDSDDLSVVDSFSDMQASEAVKSLINTVDMYIHGKHVGIYGLAGTAGTTPFNASLNIAARAARILNSQLAPVQDRSAIIDPFAQENLILNSQVLQTDQRGDTGGIINGTIGTKLGFTWYMNQNLTTYTPGTGWVTGFVLSTVSGPAGSTTLNLINATASGTIKIGDIFTVSGSTQQYVVTVAGTVSATVAVVVTFKPALVTAVTVSSAITVIGTAYTVNLAFHRDAFAFASRPLGRVGQIGNIFQAPVDPISGLAMRLEMSRQYKQNTYSFDMLYGSNLVRDIYACKIAG